MKKHLSIIPFFVFALFLLPGARALAAPDHTPHFTSGVAQTFSVCENASPVPVDSLLAIIDTDSGQTETWSVIASPLHGTLAATYTATSTGGIIVPSALTYIPSAGYSGADSFTVQISDGIDATTTEVYVTITALPSAGVITGGRSLCAGSGLILTDTVTGGAWHATNGYAIVSVTGSVTAVSPGMDSITYTTPNSCGTAADTVVITINAIPRADSIEGADSICAGTSDTLTDIVSGGTWHSSSFIAPISGSGIVTGFAPGTTTISYIVSNSCGSDTAQKTIKVQEPVFPGSILLTSDTICVLSTPAILLDLTPNGTWSSSDFLVAVAIDGFLEGISPGTATITYTLNNSCGISTATTNVAVINCDAGVNAVAKAKVPPCIQIFPNPNDGAFALHVPSERAEQAAVIITDVTGMKVRQYTAATNNDVPLQPGLPPGLYFITAISPEGKYTAKFVVR